MKSVLLPILGTVAFIIAVALLVKNSDTLGTFVSPKPSGSQELKIIIVGGREIKVEVADTESERSVGLAKRKSMPADQGMLFVFDKKGIFTNFWMKDMEMPIDIIWISKKEIIKIDKDVPVEKGVPDNKLKIYSTEKPIDYVLEVNAGFADKNSIKVGNLVILPVNP